jgi:hypothetical protein
MNRNAMPTSEDLLLTTILRAAESLAAAQCPAAPDQPVAVPALSEGTSGDKAPTEFEALLATLAGIRAPNKTLWGTL